MKIKSLFPLNTSPDVYEYMMKKGIDQGELYRFLNPEKETNVISYKNLKNIEKIAKIVNLAAKKKLKTIALVDKDLDGITSCARFIRYMKQAEPEYNIDYFVPEGKVHGFTSEFMKVIREGNYEVVVVIDGGTNDIEYQRELLDEKRFVIIMDHHVGEHKDYPALISNNHLCSYLNKNLSGVGIVQKFCEAYDEIFDKNFSDEDLDLVAVGMVADVMRVNNHEQTYYIQKGLNEIRNPFLIGLIAQNQYLMGDIDKLTPDHVSWNIAPLVNAVVRVGTAEENRKIFECFLLEEDYKVPSKKRGAKEGDFETFVGQTLREAKNIKARQERIIEHVLPSYESSLLEQNEEKDNFYVLEVPDVLYKKKEIPKSLNGLIAAKLTEKFGRPVMVTKKRNSSLMGSGRSTDEIVDLKSLIIETDLVDFASGHEGAFGISIPEKNLELLKKEMTHKLRLYDPVTFCDYIFDFGYPTNEKLIGFCNWRQIFGKGLEMPSFGIIVRVKDLDYKMYVKKSNTVRISIGDITVMRFKVPEEEMSIWTNPTDERIMLVGHPQINTYYGTTKAQIIVDEVIRDIDNIEIVYPS